MSLGNRTRLRVLAIAFGLFAIVAASVVACSNSGGLLQGSVPTGVGSGPYLVTLSVTAASNDELTLVPPFSPSIHDYYVVCAAGANALTISMIASQGATSQLLQPTESPAAPEQTLSQTVMENQAIVAAAIGGASPLEYWVRCLPHDFLPMQMTKYTEVGVTTSGYYLIGAEQAQANGGPAFAMVLDTNGVPVWYYSQPQTGDFVLATGIFNVDSNATGNVSFIPWPSNLSTSPFQIHDLAAETTTVVSGTGLALDPHELRPLPNGDYLMFTDQVQTADLTGYPLTLPDGEPFGTSGRMLPCDILEVDPKGNVVWTWVGTDHFDPVQDSNYPQVSGGPDGSPVADPFHCNSIEIDEANGNLLISSRNMDSIFYLDRSTGKVLWKMGGSTYTKDGASYVPMADPFYRQHDARFQPGWSEKCGGQGQISIFDDETSRIAPARALVYDVNVGAGDASTCGTPGATVAWQVSGSVSSAFMGSFRILPDGSRIIGWGYGGEANRVFTEVDSDGNDLLDFYFLDNTRSFRSVKVPLGELDLDVMRRTAGLPSSAINDAGNSSDGSAEVGLETGDSEAAPIEAGVSDAGDAQHVEASVGDAGAGDL